MSTRPKALDVPFSSRRRKKGEDTSLITVLPLLARFYFSDERFFSKEILRKFSPHLTTIANKVRALGSKEAAN